jgi:4-amino-4-deoxy-L-arabinose transferase-like glycosyltransferase
MIGRMSADATRTGPPPAPGSTQGERLAVAGLFLSAFLLRLMHLQQLRAHDPFFGLPSVDPRLYHEWAQAIGGDFLGSAPFFMAPLYPYTLALLYAVTGPDLLAARLLNCLLGALTCVLVWRLAREFFDRRVALLAGALIALYSMLIFYEGSLLAENLIVPLTLGVVLTSVWALDDPRVARWLLAGAVLGLSATARQNLLLYAPLLLGWMAWSLRGRVAPMRRLGLAAGYAAGIALLVLPVTLRNLVVTGDAALIATSGGSNFYSGNNPEANGAYRIPSRFPRTQSDDAAEQAAIYHATAEREEGRPLSASQASAYWFGQGLAFIRDHPGAWLRLEWRKLRRFWNAGEIWNNRSYELTREFSWVLRLPLVNFGLLAPLALLGLGLTARDWRGLFPLHAMIAVTLATALALFVLSRYRVPVVPLLAVFAAAAAVRLVEDARARKWRALAVALVALAGMVAFTRLPFPDVSLGMAHYNLANRYQALGLWDRAIAHYGEAIAADPDYISNYNNLAVVYEEMGGHGDEAVQVWQRVLEVANDQGLDLHAERARRHVIALQAGGAGPSDP